MPTFHIIAVGPPASGKSRLIRHFYSNLPVGYKVRSTNAVQEVFGQEYWVVSVEKKRQRKRNAQPRR